MYIFSVANKIQYIYTNEYMMVINVRIKEYIRVFVFFYGI